MTPETTSNNLLHAAVIENDLIAVKFLLKHGADVNSRISSPVQLQRLIVENMDANSPAGNIFFRQRTSSFNHSIRTSSPKPLGAYKTYQFGSLKHRRTDSNLSLSGNFTDLFRPMFNQTYHQHQYYQARMRNPTALHVAAANAKKEIIELLLKYDANVNAEMEGYCGDYTPLIIAILCRRPHIVEMLIQRGANVNVRSRNGKTPIHYAVKTKETELVQLLLKNGADPNARTEQDITPLHVAVERKLINIVEVLLKNGSDVNACTRTGVTPLHCATIKGHREITEMILCYGADITVMMKRGEIDVTPLLWVTESERTKIIELLNRYKSKVVSNKNSGEYTKFIKKMWKKISGKKEEC